ncbi:LOW QUALITY PROTEIN: hypothetical protein SORBI_3004G267950 [Sorghum bicolor]|uniref:Uncharacterized protein n=1 Tax=Sorghum bicolor TaxID=4558 RepID=A0A1Z5RP67_SORBI|nr:LOW QUALITY PROTEIN: hypothetical protein SORBI_3004G267950 [Sorghum bicolor]
MGAYAHRQEIKSTRPRLRAEARDEENAIVQHDAPEKNHRHQKVREARASDGSEGNRRGPSPLTGGDRKVPSLPRRGDRRVRRWRSDGLEFAAAVHRPGLARYFRASRPQQPSSLFADGWALASPGLPVPSRPMTGRRGRGRLGGGDRATRGITLRWKRGGVEAEGGRGRRARTGTAAPHLIPVPRHAGERIYLGIGRPPWVHLVHRGRGLESGDWRRRRPSVQPRSVLSSPTPAPPSSFLPDCISMTGADRPPRMEPARPLVLWLGGGEGHWATDLVRPDAADAEDGDDDGGEWREVLGKRNSGQGRRGAGHGLGWVLGKNSGQGQAHGERPDQEEEQRAVVFRVAIGERKFWRRQTHRGPKQSIRPLSTELRHQAPHQAPAHPLPAELRRELPAERRVYPSPSSVEPPTGESSNVGSPRRHWTRLAERCPWARLAAPC